MITSAEEIPKPFEGHVVTIKDGDSINVLSYADNKRYRIYLEGIDAPEYRQSKGVDAKKMVKTIVSGKKIKVYPVGYDKNKELVASVFLDDNNNVSFIMVRSGFAWCHPAYEEDAKLKELQRLAQEEGLGIWEQTEPLSPWLWREREPFAIAKNIIEEQGLLKEKNMLEFKENMMLINESLTID
jgi:endonuclease YncB( thermonuclease family)